MHLFLFFHWQRMRAMLGKTRLLFVDKLCIAQHDEDMKQQGVFGLAAFLKSTERLVVLWSPTYFSRLWCTYELAAWCRYEKPFANIRFVPVEIPPLLVVGFWCTSVTVLVYYLIVLVDSRTKNPIVVIIIIVCWTMLAYAIQRHVAHVSSLKQELDDFSIQRTACFCCSNDHVHPSTGDSLHCDREMVYETLQKWVFGSSAGRTSSDDHLSVFNREVRTSLASYVMSILPERNLFIRYSDIVFMGMPMLWVALDCAFVRRSRGTTNASWYFVEGLVLWLLAIPLTVALLMRVMCRARRLMDYANKAAKAKLLLACGLWGPLASAFWGVLWACVRAEIHLQIGTVWLWTLVICVEILLTCSVFAKLPSRSSNGKVQRAASGSLRISEGARNEAACFGCSGDGEFDNDEPTTSGPLGCDSQLTFSSEATCMNKEEPETQEQAGQPADSETISIEDGIGFDWVVAEEPSLAALAPLYRVQLGSSELPLH
eukprot:TRINITY_DN41352_c0_g1_i1.p1 TRINITY_DN41352_c0_g1~~TRINITY_DN41352_c0_g1_i1.p1  ORF type:complete len:486 (-),score=46.04 TRINITY_DN41352_c0_g1_i1:162-1619(-)